MVNVYQDICTLPCIALFNFDPKNFHATDRWRGLRISVTFYTSRLISQATIARRKCLQSYGFPVPRLTSDSQSFQAKDMTDEGVGSADESSNAVLLTQDVQDRLRLSCEEAWAEVDQLIDAHGRDQSRVQVLEFGGYADSRLCDLIKRQGGGAFSASLSQGYDLGTRGGYQRSRQQLEELQPQLAWFQVPRGPLTSHTSGQSSASSAVRRRAKKVIRNLILLSQVQMTHGDCVWISERSSSVWRDRDACSFWKALADEGNAFEWQCGQNLVRATSKVIYMECSRPLSSEDSEQDLHGKLLQSVAASLMQVHGSVKMVDSGSSVFAMTAKKECLQGITKTELEAWLDTVQKLHRKFGHPPNSLLLKNLRARGASDKLLAVAAEFKCDVCLENQIRSSTPAVSLRRKDRLWCTLQIDGFYMRFGQDVFHYLLMVDEASGFCVMEEMLRHKGSEMRQMTTAQVCKVLELRWCQMFGFPERIRLDPEGAFRGLDLGDYCASRGVELTFVPAEYHEGISEVERSIGTIRRKVETFMRAEQFHPTRVAAQMVAAHNSLARSSGWSPAQWAFGRDVTTTGHSRERDGEVCAQSAMADPTGSMHDALQIRTRAEKAFLEYRERELMSRAINSKTRPVKQFLPGDLIFYQRCQVPQDTPANVVVDRPRMNIARFYGPARVLATETRVDSEDGSRRPGTIVWAVANGRLKKFHHSQVRHASETERLVAEGASGLAFPWTFSSLAELLERGSYDDETRVRNRTSRGRSQIPARSRSLPPTVRRRISEGEIPVPVPSAPQNNPVQPDSEDDELIPGPSASGVKRDEPETPEDDEMEMIPALPPTSSAAMMSSHPDMARFMQDPSYFPESFAVLSEDQNHDFVFHASDADRRDDVQDTPVFAVTLPAPQTEQEWKNIVKNPKRFIAKSVQKGVEISYAKLNQEQRAAMDSAKSREVDN